MGFPFFEDLKVAARVGLAPTPNGLTGRRATFTLPGNGAAGRIGFPSPASRLPKMGRSLRELQSHLHRSD